MRSYQEHVAQLQAGLLRDLTRLGEESQRQMQQELDGLMRTGLPAIQSILAGANPAPAPEKAAPPPAAPARAAPPPPPPPPPGEGYVGFSQLLSGAAGA